MYKSKQWEKLIGYTVTGVRVEESVLSDEAPDVFLKLSNGKEFRIRAEVSKDGINAEGEKVAEITGTWMKK